MIRILIADDHAIVRAGLKELLADTPDMIVAGEAENGYQAIGKMRGEDWDVVLLDMSMPGKNGLDVLKQIRKEKPKLPVLILSMYPEDQYAVRALKAGAAGYVTKDTAPDRLIAAIRKVALGGKYVSASLAETLAFKLSDDAEKSPHETLTDREYQIFVMLASGRTVSGISDKLLLSVKTVSTHRSRILAKMKMKNNAELMRYAMQNKLVD